MSILLNLKTNIVENAKSDQLKVDVKKINIINRKTDRLLYFFLLF